MNRKQAMNEAPSLRLGWCIVRYARRFGKPTWKLETVGFALDQLENYGPEEVSIVAWPNDKVFQSPKA